MTRQLALVLLPALALAGASIPNSPRTMATWLMDPSALKPDARMPNLGLTQQEALDLTAFLFSQPYNPSS